jgi:hypothetical protein
MIAPVAPTVGVALSFDAWTGCLDIGDHDAENQRLGI